MIPVLKQQPMGYKDLFENIIGGICGFFGGMTMFVQTAWIDASFGESLIKAGLTAVICGFGGVGGKYLFNMVNKWWKKRKHR